MKVAVLGFAHGHVISYCRRWQAEAGMGVELVAGWDHDTARLTAQAQALGITPCGELADCLGQDGLEAVVIGVETSMHADVVEQAARAGVAIILQKPMALTLPEADRILAAVEQHGVPFTMAWQMRVDPQNLQIKQLIDSGTIGDVFSVRRRHGLPSQRWDTSSMWHFDATLNRDIWADDAAHPIDFIHWLMGPPDSVTAEMTTASDPAVRNDTGVALFRYADGRLAEVSSCFACLAAENTTEIIGRDGSIVQNYGDVPSCNVPRPDGAVGLKWFTKDREDWTCSDIDSPADHGQRIAALAEPLAAFLRGERAAIATAAEGRESLRLVLATYVSSREGRRVRLDDPAIAAV
jgi:predicted dehydrogenase